MKPEFALQTYTPQRMREELIQASNDLERLVNAPRPHSYAYTCCQDWVGSGRVSYRPLVAELFPASRGGGDRTLVDPQNCDWNFLPSWIIGPDVTLEQMLRFVDEAIDCRAWAIFTFHGVDGGHSLNISRHHHRALCRHIAARSAAIVCSTVLGVALSAR